MANMAAGILKFPNSSDVSSSNSSRMSGISGKQQLPPAPTTLSFNKDEFMKENFSIDKFVTECRKYVQLEVLREDLGLYLRLLRTAMIELINQDYADFVNLSSNLVGLDRAIGSLLVPLGQLREEVKIVETLINEGARQIEAKLNARQKIRDKKICLQQLMTAIQSIERVENLFKNETNSRLNFDDDAVLALDGNLMERVATEFNQLHFVVSKSEGLALIEELKPRLLRITAILQRNLDDLFIRSIEDNDKEGLKQCLRIYSTVDKTRDAEELFRKKIVAPYVDSVLDEKYLESEDSRGLGEMYSGILRFIPQHCIDLRNVADSLTRGTSIGFDFLVNSVWPEIVSGLEVRIPMLLYDLTNPQCFHKRYLLTSEFLDKFENECHSLASLNRLREHPSYTRFINKWNSAVYFQIRFQEIAGALESSFDKPLRDVDKDGKDLLLPQSLTLWKCLERCWSQEILLKPLIHRFWKLSLLLMSRYIIWIRETTKSKLFSEKDDVTNENSNEKFVNGLAPKSDDVSAFSPLTFIVALRSDIHWLTRKVPGFVKEMIIPCIEACGFNKIGTLNECISEVTTEMLGLLPKLDEQITGFIGPQCYGSLKLVYDIPRLFRKTNREVPNKPSSYVMQTFKPLTLFLDEHKSFVPVESRRTWSSTIMENISIQYLSITSEVLTSVKKMEDSLKRLKKARDKPSSSSTGQSSAGMSDDDKIRLQLALDVEYFGKQMADFGIDSGDLPPFRSLCELVTSAREASSTS